MANREENLKKINEQLEQLTDEQLEAISGGSAYEIADDSRFLNTLGGYCNRWGASKVFWDVGDSNEDVIKGWKKVGVQLESYNGLIRSNKYYIDGREISRDEAWEHAMKVAGRRITRKDWDW